MERLLTPPEVYGALRVSHRTLQRYVAQGRIEATRLSPTTVRFREESVKRFLDQKPTT